MLSVVKLNDDVVYHFLTSLYQDVMQRYDLVILQDRQSAPRPTDSEGYLRTYIYYRVDAPHTLQWQSKKIVEVNNKSVQRTISQKQMHIRLNFLGQHAVDASNYFNHAINSVLAEVALKPVIDGTAYEFQYNGHTDPVDLTEIEQTKWVARVEYEVLLGYVDTEDFDIDTFSNVEATEYITDGITTKPIIVNTTIGD